MLQLPPLNDLPRVPVTVAIAAASIALTGWWWADRSVYNWAGENYLIWDGMQVWRAFTSTLMHLDVLHIAFNLYWWMVFGAFVERTLGSSRLLGIFLLLAFCSSLAEFAAFGGGVGLSGVVYGLWAMLAVLQRRDERFQDAVDGQTSLVLIVWFFFCILTTITGTMPVANVAHGIGAVAGAMLGLALGASGVAKRMSAFGLVVLTFASLIAATVLWPWISFSDHKYDAVAFVGQQMFEQGDTRRALMMFEIATQKPTADAVPWYWLGVVHQQRQDLPLALAAYEEAARRSGATDEMRKQARDMKAYLDQAPQPAPGD